MRRREKRKEKRLVTEERKESKIDTGKERGVLGRIREENEGEKGNREEGESLKKGGGRDERGRQKGECKNIERRKWVCCN